MTKPGGGVGGEIELHTLLVASQPVPSVSHFVAHSSSFSQSENVPDSRLTHKTTALYVAALQFHVYLLTLLLFEVRFLSRYRFSLAAHSRLAWLDSGGRLVKVTVTARLG